MIATEEFVDKTAKIRAGATTCEDTRIVHFTLINYDNQIHYIRKRSDGKWPRKVSSFDKIASRWFDDGIEQKKDCSENSYYSLNHIGIKSAYRQSFW